MLKYKKMVLTLIVYTIIIFSYLYKYPNEELSISILYNNILFFIIIFFMYNINLENDPLITFKLNRIGSFKNYFKKTMIKNSFINIYISIGLFLSNIFIFSILGYNINYIIAIRYNTIIFIIFEIYNIFLLIGSITNKVMLIRVIILLYMILSFLLYSLGIIGELSMNILKYYFYTSSILNIIIHYLLWVYIGYLIFDFIKKRIEI